MRLCVQFGVVGVVKRDELEAILSELRPRQRRRRRRTTKAEQQSEQAKERTVHDSMTCKRRGGRGVATCRYVRIVLLALLYFTVPGRAPVTPPALTFPSFPLPWLFGSLTLTF